MRNFPSVPGFLCFWAVLAASAGPAAALCPEGFLGRRAGREDCWVRYPLDSGRTSCLSREAWLRRLRSDAAAAPLCGPWSGAWKSSSSPVNRAEEAPKTARLRFQGEPIRAGPAPLLDRLRIAVEQRRERVSAYLAPFDPRGLWRKLALDEDSRDRVLPFLRTAGFLHATAASGLHLLALAWAVDSGLRWLAGATGAPARIMIPLARFAAAIAWLVSWVLSGMRRGMLRPLLVLAARAGARWSGVRWRPWAPLATALGADALAALVWGGGSFSSGRWVYALAVSGVLLAHAARPRERGRAALWMAAAAWLPPAVWEAWRTGAIPLATPGLTLLTVPVLAVIGVPLLAAGVGSALVFGPGFPCAAAVGRGLRGLSRGCELLLSAVLKAPAIWVVPRGALCLGAGAAGILLLARGRRPRLAWAAVLCAGLALGRIQAGGTAAPGGTARRVEQLDVGQGDAALVLHGGVAPGSAQAGLIDAGPERALDESAWLELFAGAGLTALDWVMLTHLDEDHVGGLRRLAPLLPIGCVVTAEAELAAPRGQVLARELAAAGVRVSAWPGCCPFPALPPAAAVAGGKASARNSNMSSVWIPLQAGGSYLSMGDAEGTDELRAARWAAVQARARGGLRIMKISHHGSRSSTSPEVLRAYEPDLAWISAGVGNRYGHPSPEVLGRLEEAGIPVRRTDREGFLVTEELRAGVGRRPR